MAQTPVTAPVRIALMSVPSMMAMGTSVSGSFSAITAEPRGRPYLNGFCGPLPIPLDAGHVEPSADVAGHGVDASRRLFSVGLRALHHDLAGQNIVTLVIKAEDLFQIVDALSIDMPPQRITSSWDR